jgi:hypothetical protein
MSWKGELMSVRVSAIAATAAVCLLLGGVSCRRQPAGATAGKTAPAASVVSPSAPAKAVDTNLLAAVAIRHQAERAWRAASTNAAAAFKRLADAEASYSAAIGQFGLYSIPAAERDAALNSLAEAREKGDKARAESAERAMRAASDRAEEAAGKLRSGNPSIQKAYDDWMDARKAYSTLRDSEETISRADQDMTQLMEKKTRLENDRNDRAEEN